MCMAKGHYSESLGQGGEFCLRSEAGCRIGAARSTSAAARVDGIIAVAEMMLDLLVQVHCQTASHQALMAICGSRSWKGERITATHGRRSLWSLQHQKYNFMRKF